MTQAEKHPDRSITVYVNTRAVEVEKKDELTFEELARLAYPDAPVGPNVSFTITYRKGEGHKGEGSVLAGQSVKLKDGEVFNVIRTDKS